MASEINPSYVRFVKQVTNGTARTKSSYLAMQRDLLNAIKTAAWRKATCAPNLVTTVVNKVTETDRVVDKDSGAEIEMPSYRIYMRDCYDAFKQGGDAVPEKDTFCGYAGMVAYRYSLPATYNSNIDSVRMIIAASRYLRSGLRVAVTLSNDDNPSDNWDVIRGEVSNAIVSDHEVVTDVDGVSSWGVGSQSTVDNLLASRAREIEVLFDALNFSELGTSTRYAYLWVYISVEDYTDYWTWYSPTEPRYYSIEGSAQLVGSSLSVSFADDVVIPTNQGVMSVDSNFTTLDMVLPSTVYNPKGTYPDSFKTDYGNFLQGNMCAMLYLMRSSREESHFDGREAFARLLQFGVFPRKNFFSFAGHTVDAAHEDEINIRPSAKDVGVFAALRNGYENQDDESSTYVQKEAYTGNVSFSIKGNANMSSVLMSFGGVSYLSELLFHSRVITVGLGAEKYNRMRYTGHNFAPSGVVMKVNVWRTKSPDALGIWGMAALSALCSHQEMYIGDVGKCSAELTGDGVKTKDITLRVDAQLVGVIDVPQGSGNCTVDVELTETVFPGEAIIFSPKIVSIGGDEVYSLVINGGFTPSEVKFIDD